MGRELTVAVAQMNCVVGDISHNVQLISELAEQAREQGADLLACPELTLTGYPPEDLLLRPSMDVRIAEALETLCEAHLGPAIIVGAPIREGALLYNAAVAIEQGSITGRYFKRFPPNYQVFDEKRYFANGVDTTREEAEYSADKILRPTIEKDIFHGDPAKMDQTIGKFDLLYNETDGLLSDLSEAILQKISTGNDFMDVFRSYFFGLFSNQVTAIVTREAQVAIVSESITSGHKV